MDTVPARRRCRAHSSSCPTGHLVLEPKRNLLSRVRDKATAEGDSTGNLSTGSEVERHGASEDQSGEESGSESEFKVSGEGGGRGHGCEHPGGNGAQAWGELASSG